MKEKMKSYTDIEQSRKLSEILPLESADMYYLYLKDNNHIVNPQPFVADGFEEREEGIYTYLNCWSLAALLDILPISLNALGNGRWNAMILRDGEMRGVNAYNPIDACYELILKLHKLNLL